MKFTKAHTPILLLALAPMSLFLLGATRPEAIQDSGDDHQQHQGHSSSDESETSLNEQLAEIRASVARLEAALNRNHQATSLQSQASGASHSSGSMDSMGMGSMSGMGKKMGGMDKMKGQSMEGGGSMSGMMGMGSMGKGMMMQGMGKMSGQSMQGGEAMSSDSSGGMGMQMGMGGGSMKRMQMMGRMGGMGSMEPAAMLSRLPGFPGASHIYHIGASGFFLDHGHHVDLSMEQRKALAQIQEQSLLEQASLDRQIAQAEQELWVLTSAGEPDAPAIEAKVREIGTLTAEQRLSFIQSVGKAAEKLTDEQRRVLAGDLGSSFSEGAESADSVHDH